MDLKDLETWPLDHQQKSIPGGLRPVALGRTRAKGWNILAEDLPLPAAVLLDSALTHNSEWMRRFLGATGAYLAPHGKTTMSPQLFKRQLADGAWGITVANVQQLQVARDHGVRRVIMANQLIGKQAIRYVLNELKADPTFDFYCLVDSVEVRQDVRGRARALEGRACPRRRAEAGPRSLGLCAVQAGADPGAGDHGAARRRRGRRLADADQPSTSGR